MSTEQLEALERDLANLKRQEQTLVQQIADQRDHLNGLTPMKKLAITLHGRMCIHSHVDQCSWEYEMKGDVHQFDHSAHARYLRLAQSAVTAARTACGGKISDAEAIDVVRAVAKALK